MATKLKTKIRNRHLFVSVSATLVKTLAGATAYKAKRKVSVEDDKHVTDIPRGEVFYLKHDKARKAYILFDVDSDDDTIYKFIIDKDAYQSLIKVHEEQGAVSKKPAKKELTSTDISKALSTKSGVKVSAKAFDTWLEDGTSKVVDRAVSKLFDDMQLKSLHRAARLLDGVMYKIGLGDKVAGGVNLDNLLAKTKSKPKANKPQDYKSGVPFDQKDRTIMVQTIFGGKAKTTPESMVLNGVEMDAIQVKREAKKAGFKLIAQKGSVVKLVHTDGTQMDVAVKDDYLAVRFN